MFHRLNFQSLLNFNINPFKFLSVRSGNIYIYTRGGRFSLKSDIRSPPLDISLSRYIAFWAILRQYRGKITQRLDRNRAIVYLPRFSLLSPCIIARIRFFTVRFRVSQWNSGIPPFPGSVSANECLMDRPLLLFYTPISLPFHCEKSRWHHGS